MIFLHKVELFSISHLDDISSWKSFMNVQVSSNLKEKKIDMKGKRIRTHDPKCHYTTLAIH